MSRDEHDVEALGTYVLGGLDEADRRSVEEHLAGCEWCRAERTGLEEMREALGELPPEAFLDGPPDDGDVVLQRTLRRIREESARQGRRRGALAAATVAAAVVAALAAGVVLGRGQDRPSPVPAPTVVLPTASPYPAGTRVGSRLDPGTGARLTVRVVPAAGWVRVTAAVMGIPQGQRCRIWVVARDGTRVLAGSWLVSAQGARDGTTLDGSALVAPQDVAAVEVDSVAGRRFVSVPL